MLSNQYVTKLINLEGVKFKDIYIEQDEVRILVAKQSDIEICPQCGRPTTKLVDITSKIYRDLNILNRICLIEIDQRRFECRNCFHTFMEPISFVRLYRRYTIRFEREVYKCCKETNAAYAASQFGISDHTAAGIYEWYAMQKQAELKLDKEIKEIGIDEIAMHKGHQDFILVITDLSNKRVIEVLKDRKKETLEAFLLGWNEELKKGIKAVAIDLWSPYRSAALQHLPNASIVADRFHVMQNLNKALDECRKQEKNASGNKEEWKDAKYALLKNKEDLTEEQQAILTKVLNISPILKQVYDLKEQFREIFNQADSKEEAKLKLHAWILGVIKKDINTCFGFVKTLLNWEDNILNYFLDRLSSGFVEGVNNKIKLIKRKAFGFRNFENFRIKIIDCFS